MVGIQKAVAVVGLAVVLGVGAVGCSSGTQASGSSSAAASEAASSAAASAEAASTASSGAEAEADAAVADGAYVNVAWLRDNLDSVVVVDARDADSYAASHIPGAVNLTWQALSNMGVNPGEEGWAELDEPAMIKAIAEAAGVDGSKPVVVYTDVKSGWGEDGRIMWTLREGGISDVRILDGGIRKWVGGGNAYEGSASASSASSAAAPKVDEDAKVEDADPIEQVDAKFVKEHMDDAIIVDTRSEAEYNGELVYYESRMGRIPGAVSVPNVSLFNTDSTLKSDEELADIFAKAGLTDKDALVITYCTGGVRGANVAEVLEDQGFTNVKVYTAGFAEWAGDKDNKVEAEAEVPKADK